MIVSENDCLDLASAVLRELGEAVAFDGLIVPPITESEHCALALKIRDWLTSVGIEVCDGANSHGRRGSKTK